MPKYIKELISLDNDIKNDKKLLKKLFSDKIEYQRFIMSNVEWILEKTQFEFTKDELHGLLLYLKKNAEHIVHINGNTKEYATKFDNMLRKFLSDQCDRTNINLSDISIGTFASIFEQYKPEAKAKQAQIMLDKLKIAAEKQKEADEKKEAGAKILKKPQQLKNYSLEQFIDQVVMAFADAAKSNYNDLDQEISDNLH